LPPLADRIDPKKRDALARMIAETKVPAAYFDGLKTWAAGVYLLGVTVYEVGAASGRGPERELVQQFTDSKRTVTTLETPAQQFGFFDALPEPEQRHLVEDVLDPTKQVKSDYEAMLRAWLNGDVKAIARTFSTEEKTSPVLREVLVKQRNTAWADWLAKRLQRPGRVLMAVGAGHLTGPDSVQSQLAARGIKVTRIE
jgi:uncharacterized protein YbaP (TraB family)